MANRCQLALGENSIRSTTTARRYFRYWCQRLKMHELQVVDEVLPELEHDFRMNAIITPKRIIWCGHLKRRNGLGSSALSAEQIAAIPALAKRTR
jgi:hypothetical protein